jgi:peptide-methionine (S)-S-oxide reductase
MTSPATPPPYVEVATLGGGCFWCLEAVYDEISGVVKVESGYAGGHVKNPSYREVCDGTTGHAEVVQITFDPKAVSYREILEVFFVVHDPTTLDRQGADVGSQYRSVIFHHTPAQQKAAREIVAELAREQVFEDPVVTRVEPLTAFYKAEDYHQDYYAKNPTQGYCQAVISPKLAKFRATFGKLVRPR